MSQEKTEAVVLRGVAFGETSKIVTLLTPERGRLACIAKGVRRKNNPIAPVLDTFNRIEAVYYWKDGRDVHTLADAALMDAYRGMKADIERTVYAAFPLELACKIAHENEPSRGLFEALTSGLAALDAWTGDARMHACWQAVRLLDAAGFAPALDYCAMCGKELTGPAAAFSSEGGAVCGACTGGRRLGAPVWEALRALVREDRCPGGRDAVSGEIFSVLWHYAQRQLETDFRSVRVALDMFGGAAAKE